MNNIIYSMFLAFMVCFIFTNISSAETPKTVKFGIVQMDTKLMDKEFNIDKAISYLDKLDGKVDIAVLPELFTTGYNFDLIGDNFFKLAETIPGETTGILSRYAKEHNMAIIGNIVEKDPIKAGVLYDSTFVIDKEGELLGVYRKTHLYPTEHKYFRPGSNFPVFDVDGVKVGIAICYDHAFSEIFRILALKGAQVFVIPSAVPKGYEYLLTLRTRARAQDNQAFAVGVNRVGKEKDTVYAGKSLIANPKGNIIAEGTDKEEVIIGTLNLDEIMKERIQEPIFRSRRTDLYDPLTEKY